MIELIQQRLDHSEANSAFSEQQALKEILQEVALYSLWRANFFSIAAFQGGTSLRILHQLPRFSEDLDFILKEPIVSFSWQKYQQTLLETFATFGLEMTVVNKDQMDKRVQQAILKNDAVARQLTVSFPQHRSVLKIKLEIDVNPPEQSGYGWSYLDFPLDFEICHQDLPSNFSLKIHALLCRPYLKGRDWYDFNWYISHGIQPNYPHLQAALDQYGPWANQSLQVNPQWLRLQLLKQIEHIDWQEARWDVERFLNVTQRQSLNLWKKEFFIHKVSAISAD